MIYYKVEKKNVYEVECLTKKYELSELLTIVVYTTYSLPIDLCSLCSLFEYTLIHNYQIFKIVCREITQK